MKLAVIGLSLSHPETFAAIAATLGAAIDAVWDYDAGRAAAFAERHRCLPVATPEQAARRRPDGALVTCVSVDHGRLAVPFLAAGIPTFVDKPLAITRADLDLLCATANRTGTALASCSALRYAPAYRDLQEQVHAGRLGTILGGTATVCHPIAAYLQPGNTWQDEIARGGGTIVNMGIHGVEPLIAALDTGVASVHCHAATRVFPASRSEDTAAIGLQWRDGKVGTVQVVGGGAVHGYAMTLHGSQATATAAIPPAATQQQAPTGATPPSASDHHQAIGYVGTVQAMLSMFETGRPPIPLAETREVVLALLAARQSRASGAVVAL